PARARRSRALGCGAPGAAPRLGYTGAHRGRARAHADRRVWLVARAVELGGAALPRTKRHRTCPLRHPQGGPRARAAALSRSAALGSALAASAAIRTFLGGHLRDRPYEVFCCLYLDNRHRLIAFEELFRGTIERA